MPKERTFSPLGYNGWDSKNTYVTVAWGRGTNSVQVGSCDPTKDKVSQDVVEDNGWFIELDRDGINGFIRSLRRARDQAFGKDE